MEMDPSAKAETYYAKFIRVKDNIYTTAPDDIETSHRSLAHQHGILNSIDQFKREGEREQAVLVDAGLLRILHDPSADGKQGTIKFFFESDTLEIPVKRFATEARNLTGVIAGCLFPDFVIKATI